MIKQNPHFYVLLATAFFLIGCNDKPADKGNHEKAHHHSAGETREVHAHEKHDDEDMSTVHLSALKFASLGLKVDTLPRRPLATAVEVNGRLALPPQFKARVTAILGANVTEIKVIEGEKVRKGQILAYLAHPNLTNLQTAYVRAYNQMQFLQNEFERQQRLYDAGVSSGKIYQQTQADYQSMRGEVRGYETQLQQLNIEVKKIRKGDIFQYVPVVSPIDGNIEKVLIQIGQYVDPNETMFTIVNPEHVHVDLMVFEKDVHRVKEGQTVSFKITSVPGKTLTARIFTVGKNFEQNPKAVHVHAEIEQKAPFLIPGMYIHGKIHTESTSVNALPEDAVFIEEGRPYIFIAEADEEKKEWLFYPVEIRTGISEDSWVEIKLLEPLPDKAKVLWNKAYYLIAEMKKSETAHEH